jgi:hypothetical protein
MAYHTLKIQTSNKTFRIATKKVSFTEDFTDTQLEYHYYPSILSFGGLQFNLGFEGAPSLPSSSVTVADADRLLYDELSAYHPETIQVQVAMYTEEDANIYTIDTSLTDLQWQAGVLSFDIRITEELLEQDYQDYFSPTTFQYITSPSIKDVRVSAEWVQGTTPPWTLHAVDYRRTYVPNPALAFPYQFGLNWASSLPSIPQPRGIEPPSTQDALGNRTATVRMVSRIALSSLFRPFYYNAIENSINGSTQVNIKLNAQGRRAIIPSPGNPAATAEIIDLDSAPVFQNTRSYYYDFVNNIFLNNFASFTAGQIRDFGQQVPLIWDDGGVIKSLLDITATGYQILPYRFAQISSSFYINTEVVKYLVAGYGFIEIVGGEWRWTSTGHTNTARAQNENRISFISGIPNETWTIASATFNGFNDPRSQHIGAFTPPVGWPAISSQLDWGVKRVHGAQAMIQQVNTGVAQFAWDTTLNQAGAPIAFRTFDRMIVRANGFIPDPRDIEFAVGFVHTGQTSKRPPDVRNQNISALRSDFPPEFKLFNRFAVKELFEATTNIDHTGDNLLDAGSETTVFLEIDIHNLPLSSDHVFAITPARAALAEIPDLLKSSPKQEQFSSLPEAKINLYNNLEDFKAFKFEYFDFRWSAAFFDTYIDNLNEETRRTLIDNPTERNKVKNRYRGLLIDMSKDFQGLEAAVSVSFRPSGSNPLTQPSTDEVKQQSLAILDNSNGRFAICSGSEIIVSGEEVFERLYFHVSGPADSPVTIPQTSAGEVPFVSFQDAKGQYKLFTNNMYFKPIIDSAVDLQEPQIDQRSYQANEARDFFLKNRYRIFHDPVPENSEDLGRFFPICYGWLRRVPLLHVISKKTLLEDQQTAGDDTYIYASHPCHPQIPENMILEYFSSNTEEIPMNSEEDDNQAQRTFYNSIAKSPFPAFEEGHVTIEADQFRRQTLIRTPYHALSQPKSLDGKTYQGIKLRGDEWDSLAGRGDKRFPVRNGLGNSRLYGTFSGYVDREGVITNRTGSVIEHPLDVVVHYIKTYGRAPYSNNLDMATIIRSRSLTPDYKASVFIDAQIKIQEFMGLIAEQFNYFLTFSDKGFGYIYYDMDSIDLDKPLVEGINIIHEPQETQIPYKDIYSEVLYQYDFNYPADRFDRLVHLTPENNPVMAKTALSLQNKNSKTIEAKYVNDQLTARLVAQDIVRTQGQPRKEYNIKVVNPKRVEYELGRQVPVTFERLGLNKTPCLVVAKKDNEDGTTDLRLLRLITL